MEEIKAHIGQLKQLEDKAIYSDKQTNDLVDSLESKLTAA